MIDFDQAMTQAGQVQEFLLAQKNLLSGKDGNDEVKALLREGVEYASELFAVLDALEEEGFVEIEV